MKTTLSIIASLMLSGSVLAGDMMVRVRALAVTPDQSWDLGAAGELEVTSESVPEVDFTYFFNKSFALELILATATHNVSTSNSGAVGLNAGSVSLLPPTLLAQYHFTHGSKFKSYVGAGLNYTFFYDQTPGNDINDISYDDTVGYALQVGTDYEIAKNTYINFDIKKLMLSTDVEINNGALKAEVDLDPWLIGAGIAFKF